MKKLHFYFFCLYNNYYQDGFATQTYHQNQGQRGNVLPEKRTINILFLATWGWIFVIRLILIIFFKPRLMLWGIQYDIVIGIICFAFYFYYFINNNRFSDIYVNYKQTLKPIQENTTKKIFYLLATPAILIPALLWVLVKYLNINLFLHWFPK